MPIQGFNTGKDITLVIVTAVGVLQINGSTGFQAMQMTQRLDHKGLDGNNKYAEIPTGWEGSFDYDREDSVADDYFAQYEAAYYNGTDPGNATITQTITENNGGTTQYRFTGAALKFSDAGTWRGDQKVPIKINFTASNRQKVQ